MSIGYWTRAALLVAAIMVLMAPAGAAEQAARTTSGNVSELCNVQHATLVAEAGELLAAARKSGSPGLAAQVSGPPGNQTLIARINAERDRNADAPPRVSGERHAACTQVNCCGRRVLCCNRKDCRRKCPCWP